MCYCKSLNKIYKKTLHKLCRGKIKFEKDNFKNLLEINEINTRDKLLYY